MNSAPFSEPLSYYSGIPTSEYQGSPNMLAWLTANLQLFQDTIACLKQIDADNLETAVGAQLDMLGDIVGMARTVPFQPTGIVALAVNNGGTGYLLNDSVTIVQSGASNGLATVSSVSGGVVTGLNLTSQGNGYSIANGLATTGGTGTGLTVNVTSTVSPVLDDATYRLVLWAKAFSNHWNGQIDSFQAFWPSLFPGGSSLVIDDTQNMAATIILGGAFTSIIHDLIVNGYIIPRPQGVQYTYQFPSLPILGFDENTPVIAGLDQGKFL